MLPVQSKRVLASMIHCNGAASLKLDVTLHPVACIPNLFRATIDLLLLPCPYNTWYMLLHFDHSRSFSLTWRHDQKYFRRHPLLPSQKDYHGPFAFQAIAKRNSPWEGLSPGTHCAHRGPVTQTPPLSRAEELVRIHHS